MSIPYNSRYEAVSMALTKISTDHSKVCAVDNCDYCRTYNILKTLMRLSEDASNANIMLTAKALLAIVEMTISNAHSMLSAVWDLPDALSVIIELENEESHEGVSANFN